ncbi:uncharacterized protein LOC117171594 [Belonocnema kinseyi]|uniref:uncharacterized protein LOC117171594 n=1 Tax=Belonocnema kinseyi TaxID=2817044 RepID=UPI00143CFF4D|nr:uncharacterized protein LOC117171594 [Belonocnema kinseyi]
MRTTIALLLITSVVFFNSFVCVKATQDAGVKQDPPKKLPASHEEMATKEELSGVFYMKKRGGEIVPIKQKLLVWKKAGAIFAWSKNGKKRALFNESKKPIIIENGIKKPFNDDVSKRLGLRLKTKVFQQE